MTSNRRGRPRAFTNDQAKRIRQQYRAGGTTIRKLAVEHGVSPGAIQKVLERTGAYA